jgi:hypothetical protein
VLSSQETGGDFLQVQVTALHFIRGSIFLQSSLQMLFTALKPLAPPALTLLVFAAQFTGGFFGTQMQVASHLRSGLTAAQSSLQTIVAGLNGLMPRKEEMMLLPLQLSGKGGGGSLHTQFLASHTAAGLMALQSSLHTSPLPLKLDV